MCGTARVYFEDDLHVRRRYISIGQAFAEVRRNHLKYREYGRRRSSESYES